MPNYYIDTQSIEHNLYTKERDYSHTLLAHLHDNRSKLRGLFVHQFLNSGGNIKYLDYRNPTWHNAADRIEAAWRILESETFSLPKNWKPGLPLVVDSECTDGLNKPHRRVAIKYLLSERIASKACDCWDYHGLCRVAPADKVFCKHLVTYWFLAWAWFRLEQLAATTNN
jgi:hypothetical protein